MMSARSIGILSCIGVLFLYLNTTHAAYVSNALRINEPKTYQSGQAVANAEASTKIKGLVMRVEYDDYFVKGANGKEVRVHTDKTTQVIGQLKQGDLIEAEVDAQNRALWIRSF